MIGGDSMLGLGGDSWVPIFFLFDNVGNLSKEESFKLASRQ